MTDDSDDDKKKGKKGHTQKTAGTTIATPLQAKNPQVNPKQVQPSPGLKPTGAELHGDFHAQTNNQSPTWNAGQHHTHTKTITTNLSALPWNNTQQIVETYSDNDDLNLQSGSKDSHTQLNLGGSIQFGKQPKTNGTGTVNTGNGKVQPSHNGSSGHKRVGAPPTEPAGDVIVTGVKSSAESPSFDIGADARTDAEKLTTAMTRLQTILGKNGVFPDAAAITIKGVNADQLKVLIQKDYTAKKVGDEATITVDYTDHLGKAFNQSLANIPVTHDNLEKLTNAFEKASEAVKELATHVKPGGSLSQDEITNTVRSTIKKEMTAAL